MSDEYKIFLKGEDKTQDVESFKHRGNKCDVTFKGGKTFSYNASNVRIEESVLKEQNAKEFFKYLRELADQIGITIEIEDGQLLNILANSYSKIGFIDPKSLLGMFLSGEGQASQSQYSGSENHVIYPFGFNSSQKQAVDNALSSRISVIEGPPGTGKTQTILNIISNLVMNGKSIAVVSSNNSATKNVFDKLHKNNVDFVAASLGSRANKEEFVESQRPLPDMSEWVIDDKEAEKLKFTITTMQSTLERKLEQKVVLSNFKQELSALEIEAKHFDRYARGLSTEDLQDMIDGIGKSSEALDSWLLCEESGRSSWMKEFLKYLYEVVRRGKSQRLFVFKKLKNFTVENLVEAFQKQFYNLRLTELRKAIADLESSLGKYDFDNKMNEYSDLSFKLFRAELSKRYKDIERAEYEVEDLWRNPLEFLEEYPVILSTTYSLRSSLSSEVTYDYLIIDESSQVDLCTGALALSCAENVVIVGDLKQLPHVVDTSAAKITDEVFGNYDLSENFRYKSNSLLSSVIGVFPDVPRTFLREHYRCSPKIIDFCNKKFYDDQLVIMTSENTEVEPLMVYKTVKGNHQRGRMNQRQIDVIKEEIIPQQSLNTSDGSLGIITPYRSQTNQLQKAFEGTGVQADTVNKFQGQEKEIVILSTVDNDITKFTDNENRLNVAISRAIDQLILVVNDSEQIDDTNIGDLIKYIQYNNLTEVESKVYSIFDYLYRSYGERRKKLLSKRKRVSEFDSENLMHALIEDVLSEGGFKQFGVSAHVPLKMIVKEVKLLSTDESLFVANIKSHIDFLIYDKISKEPKLAVEVDGTSFHREGSKQALRDSLKNEIFQKLGIPLLRFRTDGSNEKQLLMGAVSNLVL